MGASLSRVHADPGAQHPDLGARPASWKQELVERRFVAFPNTAIDDHQDAEHGRSVIPQDLQQGGSAGGVIDDHSIDSADLTPDLDRDAGRIARDHLRALGAKHVCQWGAALAIADQEDTHAESSSARQGAASGQLQEGEVALGQIRELHRRAAALAVELWQVWATAGRHVDDHVPLGEALGAFERRDHRANA